MQFKSLVSFFTRLPRVTLVAALVVMSLPPAFAQNAHLERLEAPVGQLDFPPPLRKQLEALTQRMFRKSLSEAPLRWLLTNRFYDQAQIHRGRSGSLATRLQTFFATQNLPCDLTNAELELFHARPDHPIFAVLDHDVDSEEVRHFIEGHELHFLIDLVKILKSPEYRRPPYGNSDVIAELRQLAADRLSTSIDTFDARYVNADIKRAGELNKPSLAECERIMSTMTNDELNRAYVKIMSRRLNPDGDQR